MKNFDQKEIKNNIISKFAKKYDLDLELSRYMTLDRFLENLNNDSLLFNNPNEWNHQGYDNYEDLISRAKLPSSFNINGINFFENFFAICWNKKKEESEKMWKEYASLDKGIRIKVRLSDIISCIIDNFFNIDYFNNTDIFQSKSEIEITLMSKILFFEIDYKNDNEILESIKKYLIDINDKNRVPPYSHIINLKREKFSYEEEYRICIDVSLKETSNNKLIIYGINKYISEITLSPKFEDKEFESLKNKLESNQTINAKISKSKM